MVEPEPLNYTGFLVRRSQQRHVAVWQREVSSSVSSVQFGVLAVLARRPGASQRELGDELDLDRSTIADLVARLQRHGFLQRERHDTDRRRNALELTEAGHAELKRLRPRVDLVEHALTDGLSAEEREELRRLLHRLLDDDPPMEGQG
jgi:DNA-binding MarR family transcriptional regulator